MQKSISEAISPEELLNVSGCAVASKNLPLIFTTIGMAHHHHHHHGQCDHSAGGDPAVLYSLYKKIDLINLQCYNESEEGAGRTVFKPWEQRQDHTKVHDFDAHNNSSIMYRTVCRE